MVLNEEELIRKGLLQVAELMAVAAKTAPKAKGVDNVTTLVLDSREEVERLADAMDSLSKEYGEFMARDAESVRRSDAVFLIGVKVVSTGLKTYRGYRTDVDTTMALVNLGIALGSAVKIASLLNVDNRIMYSIGIATQELRLLEADYVLGVPLSAKSKSPYFDRK